MPDENVRTVLMADDDSEDCILAMEAFKEVGVNAAFRSVQDGMELVEYLASRSHATSAALPNLILLDLNMPRKDGREALLEIKSTPALRNIPIVILTTSKDQKDVEFMMRSGAESFITKPATFGEWIQIMRVLTESWLC